MSTFELTVAPNGSSASGLHRDEQLHGGTHRACRLLACRRALTAVPWVRFSLAALGPLLLLRTADAAVPATAKVENGIRYRLAAVHGPLGPGHFDAVVPVLPAIMWTNDFLLSTPGVGPLSVTGAEVIWHNVNPHGPPELPFFGPYVSAATATPPPAGPAVRVGLGAGRQFHQLHWDTTLSTITAQYASPAAILGCTYAAVGIHDPPPGCYERGGGLSGGQVVPANASLAFASAAGSILLTDNSFELVLAVRGISLVNLQAASVRVGGTGENGPLILDLGPPAMWQDLGGMGLGLLYEGFFPAAFVGNLLAGRTYVQVDTVAFPAGEIRGQLVAAPLYSNSGRLDDPFQVTRAGGHCSVNGDATDVQTALGLSIDGWDASALNNSSVADDFEVPPGQTWLIEGITLYAYQMNATLPTISGVYYAISDTDLVGQPPPPLTPAAVISDWTNTFKKKDVDDLHTGCDRRIQRVFVPISPAYEAGPGRHWLAWSLAGSPSRSGVLQPPVVIPGQIQKPGANGLQSLNGLPYTPVADGFSAAHQDFVFELSGAIEGRQTPGACPGDANCDHVISWRDIDYFVAAQNDNQSNWYKKFLPGTPSCLFSNNDVNNDGHVSWRDITPFVQKMNTTCP